MPVRATKRGAARTPLGGDFDVLICGASFAGLAVARELRVHGRARAGARPLRDRRAPDLGVRRADGVAGEPRAAGLDPPDVRLAAGAHAARATARWPLPFTFSTFDYRQLCALLWEQRGPGREFETAKVSGRDAAASVHTDRGDVSAPLVVDALGWRRVLGAGANVQPPDARLSRGLEVHPGGRGRRPRAVDRPRRHPRRLRLVVPGRRRGARRASARSTRTTTSRSRPCAWRTTCGATPSRYQGNWIPHRLRAGRRGRSLLRRRQRRPLPAADRRGDPHRVLLRDRAAGASCATCWRGARRATARWSATARSRRAHRAKFEAMLLVQRAVPAAASARARRRGARVRAPAASSHWGFGHYLKIAPPEFALPAPRRPPRPSAPPPSRGAGRVGAERAPDRRGGRPRNNGLAGWGRVRPRAACSGRLGRRAF